jgi:hypothetical protein
MRDEPIDLAALSYTPEKLLDEVAFVMQAPNRNQVARNLDLDPALLCRIVKRQAPLTALVMVRIMDRTGWGIRYVRELAGIPYDGIVYPPRVRRIEPVKGRVYHTAKDDILQSMPGTVSELVARSGYSRETVYTWIRQLRCGDPLSRESHIIGWLEPTGPRGSGGVTAIHAAGPGEDAPRIPRKRCRVGQQRTVPKPSLPHGTVANQQQRYDIT